MKPRRFARYSRNAIYNTRSHSPFTSDQVHVLFYLRMYHDASVTSRLFLAALPDAPTALRIHRLAGLLKRAHNFSGKLIPPDRLHVSLFFLGGLLEPFVHSICEGANELRISPFEISFDRTASFRGRTGSCPFVLIGGEGLDRLKAFRRALSAELARKGLKQRAGTSFEPHVTLLYDGRSVDEYPLGEPISWTIDEIVLIRSRYGHVHVAKWRLRA